jgi:hypothetical protein
VGSVPQTTRRPEAAEKQNEKPRFSSPASTKKEPTTAGNSYPVSLRELAGETRMRRKQAVPHA